MCIKRTKKSGNKLIFERGTGRDMTGRERESAEKGKQVTVSECEKKKMVKLIFFSEKKTK